MCMRGKDLQLGFRTDPEYSKPKYMKHTQTFCLNEKRCALGHPSPRFCVILWCITHRGRAFLVLDSGLQVHSNPQLTHR